MNKQPFATGAILPNGFTFVELVVTLMIVGILAVTILPRFADRQTFNTRGVFEDLTGTLRFAHQQAVAQRRLMCVTVNASSFSVTRARAVPPAACDGTALLDPSSGSGYARNLATLAPGVSIAARGATAALPVTISFDALGRAVAAGLRVNGDGSFCLNVEAETGYVYAVACP
jgi:MSHA pilin protein MshC